MIFRWSVWGQYLKDNIELLNYSILSFQKQFGNHHRYIVYTDDRNFILNNIKTSIEVKEFPKNSIFYISSKATWKKWCPEPRLDINQDEFFIDSDVFLLKKPDEINDFLENNKYKFCILDEFSGQSFQHGAMSKRVSKDVPFVNAGLFIQKAGYSISDDLIREYNWWQLNISDKQETHHDEQGALAIVLTKYLQNKELYILPKEKYMIISQRSNVDVEDIGEVTLFHSTYPTHPAFYRFKDKIERAIFNS